MGKDVIYKRSADGTKYAGSVSLGGAKNIPTASESTPEASPVGSGEKDVRTDYSATQALLANLTTPTPSTQGTIDLDLFEINDSYPFPQANSLAKLAATVDAIEAGADTDDAIAHAIGVDARQGSYYSTACGYLGLATERAAGSPRSWEVTSAGAEFLNADAPTRAAILEHTVNLIPEVRRVLNDGEDMEELLSQSMSDSTAGRRAATINSWIDSLTDTASATADLELETDGMRERIDGARQVAVDARARARRLTAQERPLNICPTCNTALPLTGVCDNCD